MMRTNPLTLPCVLSAVLVAKAAGECMMTDKECVFYFEIDHKLTMMDKTILVHPANGKLYNYTVTDVTNAIPVPVDDVITGDGWEKSRLVTVVNGTMPGPDIIVYKDQRVIVHVKNKLMSQAATIHWHGLIQWGTPWMDGVPWVTQCPIHPGQTFRYNFTATPSGTYWWHSHMGSQRVNGVFGALIIREQNQTNVEEHIMQISDWNHDEDAELDYTRLLYGLYENRTKWNGSKTLDGSSFAPFEIQSGLINGRGRYYDPKTNESNMAPLTVFNVTQGRKYRFRVICPGTLYPFRVSVDGHLLTVIASDGNDLEPQLAESFVLNPGERFDFEITADQAITNYWIRGITLEKGQYHRADAILRYVGAPEEEPTSSRQECTQQNSCLVLNCPFKYYPEPFTKCRTFDKMKSGVTNDPAPPYVRGKFQEYFLNFGFPGHTSHPASINGRTFDTPDVNPLTQPTEWYSPCEAPACGEDLTCKCTFALNIGNNDTVQMVFLNMGSGRGEPHPIHMHGHDFYVVKMGYGQYNETSAKVGDDNSDINCRGNPNPKLTFCNNATWSNSSWLNGNIPDMELQRPPRKDTIIVPTGGYVVLRIRADNPGIWNMHCHIEQHNLNGMQMLINESFTNISKAPDGFPTCHSFPPRIPPPADSDGNSAPICDGQVTKETSWTAVGVLIAVICIQAIVITIMAIRCMIAGRRWSNVPM